MNAAEVVQELKKNLPNAVVFETDFKNEITIEVKKENLFNVLSFFKNGIQPGFEVLMDLTGVDYLQPYPRTKVVYWLHNPTTYTRLRVVLFADRDEAIPSVVSLWAGADWYERELYDLFGVKFEGHPDMKRILMPDDWVGHPLRKDYPLTEEPVEFKHGVKPKVPSQIIPNVKSKQRFNPFGTYVEGR